MKTYFEAQTAFYQTGKTRDLQFRVEMLEKLLTALDAYENRFYEAFRIDLHKSEFEVYSTEIGIVKKSIRYAIKNVRSWAKPEPHPTPLILFKRKSYTMYEPYGTVLIIGPFNYPVQTVIEPLIGAIAAGNTAFVKPSELTPHVAEVIEAMISEAFPDSYIRVVQGGVELSQALLDLPFDLIFFTGSIPVGKIILEKAARHLTPVVLELGGKSPAILFGDANLRVSVERLMWGKLLNAGQTCIAPDYVLVHHSIYDETVALMRETIDQFYGNEPKHNADYTHIVNERHAARLARLIDENREAVLYGGEYEGCYVAPTLFKLDDCESSLMKDEIFGPLLPILVFHDEAELDAVLKRYPNPLAFYVFTEDKQTQNRMMNQYAFGGGMINDTLLHSANEHLPFGGVGASGTGAYHGKASFTAFSHQKSVMNASTSVHLSLLFPPYKDRVKILKRFL